MTEPPVPRAHVVRPEEGESHWQPVPACGHIEIRVSHRRDPAVRELSTGIQVVPPGCHVREHVHPAQEELLFVYEGRGEAVIEGEAHALVPGTTVYVPPGTRHRLVNTGTADLAWTWVMIPGGEDGLDDFFARIGRPRRPGEPAPEPFPRPDDVERIEAATVFGRRRS